MVSGKSIVSAAAVLLAASAAQADLKISTDATQNVSCSQGVCTATAQKAVLNVTDLANMLASGDATVQTGGGAKDIDISAALSWTSTSRLTLSAERAMEVDQPISVAGSGALTLSTENGKTVDVAYFKKGNVTFFDLNSSLVINGNSYTLVGDIKTLAADIAANPSGFYALAKSYDASADGTYTDSPITTMFEGTFDGLNNVIANMTIKFPSDQAGLYGLFAEADTPASLRHVGIMNADLEGTNSAGYYGSIGPLVGYSQGKIERCWASGLIALPGGGGFPGGLVGGNDTNGIVVASRANVKIEIKGAIYDVGGLVGASNGMIENSYAAGRLIRRADDVNGGGLVGYNSGIVANTFAIGEVRGANYCCSNIGGLVGENDVAGQIKASYAAAEIRGHPLDSYMGGFVGFDGAPAGNISHTYWDLDDGISDPSQGAGNIQNDPGITGLTIQQLQSGLPDGFDPKVWTQSPKVNNGLPYLREVPIK